MDVTQLVAVALGCMIPLIFVVGITMRFAAKPLVEALGKLREIAVLKLIGTRNRTIAAMILQQAVAGDRITLRGVASLGVLGAVLILDSDQTSDYNGLQVSLGGDVIVEGRISGDVATVVGAGVTVVEALAADAPSQIAAVQTAIAEKPDALIIFPQDGDQLTGVGKAAMKAGIPVVNLDRKFNDASAYRMFLAGDNYKVGYNAGTYICGKLGSNKNAVIGEITGIATLALTKERSDGFKTALGLCGLKVSRQVNASFTVQSGQQAMANLLAAAPKLDAVFNHDDDQNIGSEAAAKQAGRTEFFIVGNACSNTMLKHIKDGDARIEADVTFTPAISATAVSMARLIAQGRSMEDLAGLPLPSNMLIDSDLVTKDNVAQFEKFGWD